MSTAAAAAAAFATTTELGARRLITHLKIKNTE
jgi:hypothetical protein